MRLFSPERLRRLPLHLAAIWIGLSLSLLVDQLASFEWTQQHCTTDGVISAYGVPLPYMRWCGYTSLRYNVLPHVLAFDLLVFAIPAWLLAVRLARAAPRLCLALGVLAALHVGLTTSAHIVGWWLRLYELEISFGEPLLSYRPVVWPSGRAHYGCTPSPYWFGESAPTP